MPEVIVIGDVDTDQFYIISHIPTWDEGILVDEGYEVPGGKAGNTAATLSRLGLSTGIVASVGDDRYGEIATRGLKEKGVDLSGMITVPGGKTYYCIMMLDGTGEKAILVIRSELLYPSQQMLLEKESYIASAKHAHFIGIDPGRMQAAMERAKKHGLSVSVDLDAAYQGLDACLPAIRQADVVFVNRQGCKTLFPGKDLREAARELKALGPSIAVITAGSQGVVAWDGSHLEEFPAFHVKVKDTTGSGDVFSGAFINCYLKKQTLSASLRFASAAAALSTAAIGGQGALPSLSEVLEFLDQHASM